MVTHDYIMTMSTKKPIGVADFKAHLSEYLRDVRRGHSLTIQDRDQPIARVVPYEQSNPVLAVREARKRYGSLASVPLPPPLRLDVDPVALLLEDRGSEE
jgi:prevent-host-death family protein